MLRERGKTTMQGGEEGKNKRMRRRGRLGRKWVENEKGEEEEEEQEKVEEVNLFSSPSFFSLSQRSVHFPYNNLVF